MTCVKNMFVRVKSTSRVEKKINRINLGIDPNKSLNNKNLWLLESMSILKIQNLE